MRQNETPDELGLAILILRALYGWTQVELAKIIGTTPSVISEYETGRRHPSRKAVTRVAEAAGISFERLEVILLPALRALRPRREGDATLLTTLEESLIESFSRIAVGVVREGAQLLLHSDSELPDELLVPLPEDRDEGRDLWARLERYGMTLRRTLVEGGGGEFQSWSLCELLCERSLEFVEDGTDLELAELALLAAARIRGGEAWRSRVQGYAWAHIGNARRRHGDLPGAREAFARFRQLWDLGTSADPGLLDEARVIELEAFATGPTP